MMEVDDIASAWERASQSDKAQGYIHPSGHVGPDQYEESGKQAAAVLMGAISPYLTLLPVEPKVLDFGCGDGRVLKYVIDEFPETWGADASQGMLDRLAQRVPSAKRAMTNGVDGRLNDSWFDFIYSWAVFIHHDHAGGREMLLGLAGATAPGGFLAIQMPCYDVPRERDGWIDVTVWDENLIRAAARRAGLEVVELHKCPGEFSYSAIGENHFKVQIFRNG